ncbi:2055_t:CDS:2 [Entrophospora sp. SA101]|nr:2055_t:CDS:2 [Entrophospora sp. SA101]
MQVKKFENHYIIRIEPGEPLMAIKYAFSVGFETGYIEKKAEGPLELLNADGCLAWDHADPTQPAVHLHATFIDNELEKAFGGHLIEAQSVGLTAEIKVVVLSKEKITRKLDERVNVKLLNLPPYSAEKYEEPQPNNTNKPGINFKHLEEDILRFGELSLHQREKQKINIKHNQAWVVCGGKDCNKTLLVEKEGEKAEDENNYYLQVELPGVDRIEGNYRSGILKLTIPKVAQSKLKQVKITTANKMNDHKRLNAQASNYEQLATENRVFQELREIKNEIKEVKKFLIINSLRHLVNNYEKITQAKQAKLAKD